MKNKSDVPASTKQLPHGNKTEGSKNYKDPVGKGDKTTPPPTSGYDEKQPAKPK
jgi:hypothetical protein